MNVLVNGIGNIGTTLLNLLTQYQSDLGIDEVYAFKNQPQPWHIEDLDQLQKIGVKICTRFKDDGYLFLDEIIDQIDYIFDCTNNEGGMKNKEWYVDLPNLKGASAQGSEKKFGKSFMTGINNDTIKNQKYVHIVSCNTHSLSSLLSTFAGDNLENLEDADFVVVRRSEDIGNHQRLVTANVVARHLDDSLGTHHSIDLQHLFETKGILVQVTSSDITTPSQLMHSVRFNITFKKPISEERIFELIQQNPYISTTTKFDSNVIFERGRRNGFQGRIFSHAIIVHNNILRTSNTIKGWAFIPQEGNTLLSTIHAFILQMDLNEPDELLKRMRSDLIFDRW